MVPLTPQTPIESTTTQISWSTRSRFVVSANPTRHMNNTFSTLLHMDQTPSPKLGMAPASVAAAREVIVIHTANTNVNTANGVSGSCFGSLEISHERQVTNAMM